MLLSGGDGEVEEGGRGSVCRQSTRGAGAEGAEPGAAAGWKTERDADSAGEKLQDYSRGRAGTALAAQTVL